jgi:hypothetical protein
MRHLMFLSVAAATMLAATAAQAVPMSCPITRQGKPLTAVSLFDGPPAEGADLRPQEGRERNGLLRTWWSLAEIRKGGRQPHVVCDYANGQQVTLTPGKTIKTCVRFMRRLDEAGNYSVYALRCE